MSPGKFKDPLYLPFYGVIFVLAGAVNFYISLKPCYGDICGLNNILSGLLFVAAGIIFSFISGLIVALKYRKRINWPKYALLWILVIVFSYLSLLISTHL
jgi:uncharacterized membrane protein HdeD (DUF308 family)